MKITVLGIVVILVAGVVLFTLYQRSQQNQNPGPELGPGQTYEDWQ